MTSYKFNHTTATDERLLLEIGQRLAQQRIRLSLTQAQLAQQAGLGKRTLERLEGGQSVQLVSLLRALRALDLLDGIDMLLPEPRLTPLQLADGQTSIPQRAPRQNKANKPKTPWTWAEDK